MLIHIDFSLQIFEKYSNLKFRQNSSSRYRVVTCGRTDGRTEKYDKANSHSSQFWEAAPN